MNKNYFVAILSFILVGCLGMPEDNKTAAPTPLEPSTKIEGQIYYSQAEVLETVEGDFYEMYQYQLYNFRAYLLGDKHCYKLYPDYEGYFSSEGIEPGHYQIVIKSKEYFQDINGQYTFMYMKNVDVYNGYWLNVGTINPIKTYVDAYQKDRLDQKLH